MIFKKFSRSNNILEQVKVDQKQFNNIVGDKVNEGGRTISPWQIPHRPVSTSLGLEPEHVQWGKGER